MNSPQSGEVCPGNGFCPAHRKPDSHLHLPESTRAWRPVNSLIISQDVFDLAQVIIKSYDGLTDLERKEMQAAALGKTLLSLGFDKTEATSLQTTPDVVV